MARASSFTAMGSVLGLDHELPAVARGGNPARDIEQCLREGNDVITKGACRTASPMPRAGWPPAFLSAAPPCRSTS